MSNLTLSTPSPTSHLCASNDNLMSNLYTRSAQVCILSSLKNAYNRSDYKEPEFFITKLVLTELNCILTKIEAALWDHFWEKTNIIIMKAKYTIKSNYFSNSDFGLWQLNHINTSWYHFQWSLKAIFSVHIPLLIALFPPKK